MATRTTIMLDDESRAAADELARLYGCSMSEAIRRAVLQHRAHAIGVSAERRKARTDALRKLSEDGDPAAEVARIKAEDAFS